MAGSGYMLVAGGKHDDNQPQNVIQKMRSYCDATIPWNIPDLKFGTFDALVDLLDDMPARDREVERLLRKFDRCVLEIGDADVLTTLMQEREQYLSKEFHWDQQKVQPSLQIQKMVLHIRSDVDKLDEKLRKLQNSLTEKRGHLNSEKRANEGGYATRDLGAVLQPDQFRPPNFRSIEETCVASGQLCSLAVVVPSIRNEEFINSYSSFNRWIVPGTALELPCGQDQDGASLYRIVCMKKFLDEIQGAMRQNKFIARVWEFDAEAHHARQKNNATMAADTQKDTAKLMRFCGAASKEVFILWMHLKAMYVFVDSVLRFGVPPHFRAFLLKPKKPSMESSIRRVCEDILCSGQKNVDPTGNVDDDDDRMGGGEEFHPYVSLTFDIREQHKH